MKRGALRERYAALCQKAAEAGVPEAKDFFDRTPWEISLILAACRAREKRRMEEIWLAGRYAALAFHAPERMPDCPSAAAPLPDMTDEEMKRRLLSWARKGANS